ncbi:hypothetical protein GQ600_4073 [Phytophthora cactorum]|nr:hypothetical protein GQ600_4073 [Phytophthora cactorum]
MGPVHRKHCSDFLHGHNRTRRRGHRRNSALYYTVLYTLAVNMFQLTDSLLRGSCTTARSSIGAVPPAGLRAQEPLAGLPHVRVGHHQCVLHDTQ